MTSPRERDPWPALPLEAWQPTYHNLHMWTQIVGKVRLALTPKIEPLVERAALRQRARLDHLAHSFRRPWCSRCNSISSITSCCIDRCDGLHKELALAPRTVADFYAEFMSALRGSGYRGDRFTPSRWRSPTRFHLPKTACTAPMTPTRPIVSGASWFPCDEVFKQFRAGFLGKCSPVHFFWGSFDLAVTRFSGRRAPERPDADRITREAYSHEVISARLVAGRGWREWSRVLFLHGAGTGGAGATAGSSRCGFLPSRTSRNFS